jgi:hypothetical protein
MTYAALLLVILSGCVTRRECYQYADVARASGRIQGIAECDKNVASELQENMKLLDCRHDLLTCKAQMENGGQNP